jgi:hypothetical protein
LPLGFLLSPGNEYDSQKFIDIMESIRIHIARRKAKMPAKRGKRRCSYDSRMIKAYIKRRGIKCNIPSNNRNRKNPRRGRPNRFDEQVYKKRGCVKRFFGRLKTEIRRWQQDTIG